jgi:hypothetical protein
MKDHVRVIRRKGETIRLERDKGQESRVRNVTETTK